MSVDQSVKSSTNPQVNPGNGVIMYWLILSMSCMSNCWQSQLVWLYLKHCMRWLWTLCAMWMWCEGYCKCASVVYIVMDPCAVYIAQCIYCTAQCSGWKFSVNGHCTQPSTAWITVKESGFRNIFCGVWQIYHTVKKNLHSGWQRHSSNTSQILLNYSQLIHWFTTTYPQGHRNDSQYSHSDPHPRHWHQHTYAHVCTPTSVRSGAYHIHTVNTPFAINQRSGA